MRTLDRYVASAIALRFGLALGGFVLIFSVIALMEELRSVGHGEYELADAIWFVFLRLPAESFELFPGAALVGCVMGLGALAARSELIAMHAGGVSYLRLAGAVLQTAAVAGLAMAAFAEWVAAPLARTAHFQRSIAMSEGQALASASGMWTRSGSVYINVRSPLNDGTLRDVFLYEFDADHRLRRHTHADSGYRDGDGWWLEGGIESVLSEEGLATTRFERRRWDGLPLPRGAETMLLPAEDISLVDLRATIATLRRENLLTHRYELAFWKRITTPAIALIMMLIAMPLVLATMAEHRQGRAVVIAALAGVGFQLFKQKLNTLALV